LAHALIAMTTDHSDRRHLALAAELVCGEQQSMQQDLDYRQQELSLASNQIRNNSLQSRN
jgi:hypothetical protein